MSKSNHVSDDPVINELHESKKKDGACLWRHERRITGNPCSHIWQAKVKTGEYRFIYDYPAYSTLCDTSPGGTFLTALRSNWPRGYGQRAASGGPGYWKQKPTHSGKEWNFEAGKNPANFDRYDVPYWHNSHHIIPNRALANAINEAAKKDSRLAPLIQAGLLNALYNLNDKINMIILPMERIVAAALGLPRHLKRDEVGPNEKKEFRSHADYSKKVEDKLRSVMTSYQETLAKALEPNHKGPPDDISKERLEELSETIFKAIIAQGPSMAGQALSALGL